MIFKCGVIIMPNLNMGYPKRTGNAEQDLMYMYNFLCEMSDRLDYVLGILQRPQDAANAESGEEASE